MWIIFNHECFNLDNVVSITVEGTSIVLYANNKKIYAITYDSEDKVSFAYNTIVKSIFDGDKCISIEEPIVGG